LREGRGRASGIEVKHHPAGVGTRREDKIVPVELFVTRQEAVEVAGLAE